MEDRLRETLTAVNDWLRFAEAKNALLVAANGGAIIGVLQVAGALDQLHIVWRIYLYNLVGLAALSLIIGLTSFIPTLNFGKVLPRSATKPMDNPLYFGAVFRYSPEQYLAQLYKAHDQDPPDSLPRLEVLYANQVVINSRIAIWKMDRFTVAAWVCVMAFVTPILTPAIWYVNAHSRVEDASN